MTKILTYRGIHRITPEQVKDLRAYFGPEEKAPYHWIQELEIDQNYDTFLPQLVDIASTIQCDPKLNAEEIILKERIAKGLTPSTSYTYKYVEEGMMFKLVNKAIDLRIKEGLGDINLYEKWSEVYRYFGLPFTKTFETEIAKAKQMTEDVTKPKKFYNWKGDFGQGQDSAYKMYRVKVKREYRSTDKGTIDDIYDELSFVGKIYHEFWSYSGFQSKKENDAEFERGWDYWQIYVYDQHNRNWALQHALAAIIKKGIFRASDLNVSTPKKKQLA